MLLRRAETGPLLRRLYFRQEGLRLARYERQQCPRFDLNIVCSELDAVRLAESIHLPRVVTIENGVDVDYFQPSDAPADPHKLIFVGTMNWYPNVDAMRFFLSEVWPILTRMEPKMSIDIIGANPPADLLEFARKDPRVKVHGFVDDVRPYLAAAAVYVCPIRDGGGTKLKVLDAFASGVPMVAHPVACEGIAAEDGKHVMFAREAEEFATRIQQLSREEIARRRLSMHARKLVEDRYSVGSIGRRLHQQFASLRGDQGRAKCAG
jgi:glycosyltransferase involved in cell wall biosynthesis